MLELKNIKRDYKSGDTVVNALKGVTMSFRKSEFVSILGPSGCGKTTLLNLIGGLDSYTSGDIRINGRSTKQFKDRDWDVYRNHRIGFIFQSYNLIPHQTVLGNVELALTIAGMSKKERIEKAKAALDKVGLADQYYKRPNQLSGGQSQRVAIARALVNDPEILLADEPTGALDTKTSVQIMDLVQEISRDRLVIMVTHNPELAEQYSTRIIQLLDGNLISDSNPLESAEEETSVKAEKGKRERGTSASGKKETAKMSFFTAFMLSLHNLLTKKRRTLMTSIAGSIGIIGVSLVLAVSYGVQSYINNMQNDMLSGNPITVQESAFNITAMMQSGDDGDIDDIEWKNGKVNVNATIASLVKRSENMSNLMQENEISQNYIDYLLDMPEEYVADISLDWGLNLSNNIYADFTPALTKPVKKPDGTIDAGNGAPVNSSLTTIKAVYASLLGDSEFSQYSSYISTLDDLFQQISPNNDYILEQYNLLPIEGNRYATGAGELMLVLQPGERISDLLLAQLGFYTQNEFMNMVFRATQSLDNKAAAYLEGLDKFHFEYSEILNKEFTYYPNDVVFQKSTNRFSDPLHGIFDISSFEHIAYSKSFSAADKARGIPLKIVGVLEPKEDLSYGSLTSGFFYTAALREEIFKIEAANTNTSGIVQFLTDNGTMQSNIGVDPGSGGTFMTGGIFEYEYTYPYDEWHTLSVKDTMGVADEYKVLSTKTYTVKGKGNNILAKNIVVGDVLLISSAEFTVTAIKKEEGLPRTETKIETVGSSSPYAGMASMLNGIPGMDALSAMLGGKTLSLRELSGRNADGLTIANYIAIYPVDFKTKDSVLAYMDAWNGDDIITFTNQNGNTVSIQAADRSDIAYTDILSLIIAILNTFISIITVSLVCFTSLSLVVSTVMIAIITYVSVVERIKEIGVIRSLGGRKRDVSALFNAETFIIGLVSGLIGIGVTFLASFIINLLINTIMPGIGAIAVFPWFYALIMVAVSVLLTLLSGLLPASAAAHKDPVVALRTE